MRLDSICNADRNEIWPCRICGTGLTQATAIQATFRGRRLDNFGRRYHLCVGCMADVDAQKAAAQPILAALPQMQEVAA